MRSSRHSNALIRYSGLLFLLLPVMVFISCCTGGMPVSFVRVIEPTWATIEVRDDLTFEKAWQEVIDVLAKKFELEMISKDGGYIRSSWVYTWWKAGELTENYRVRTIVKFSPDHKVINIKTEANYLDKGEWILGTDTRLLLTVKTDIMGVVGRTTK
jgi:hypothetical protein